MTLACIEVQGQQESLSLIHFVSESGGSGTFLGYRRCITLCSNLIVQEVTSMNVLNGSGSGCCPLG